MSIVCAVVSDRGDLYLPHTLLSLKEHLAKGITQTVVNDSQHTMGMAGAVRKAWEWATDQDCDYLLHWEEDFVARDDVPLAHMVHILEREPRLAQVVLKRQPWNPQEQAAGGIIECDPDAYTECSAFGRSIRWTEHKRIFSLNPCLIPRRVLELEWPDGNEAEFTDRCRGLGYRFAFYGRMFDPPRVEHVGVERATGWRL